MGCGLLEWHDTFCTALLSILATSGFTTQSVRIQYAFTPHSIRFHCNSRSTSTRANHFHRPPKPPQPQVTQIQHVWWICLTLLLLLLLSRAAFVVPVCLLHNRCSSAHLAASDIAIIWWSGLMRGAVSVALVYHYFDPTGKSVYPKEATLVSATSLVVLVTLCGAGAATKPMMDWLSGGAGAWGPLSAAEGWLQRVGCSVGWRVLAAECWYKHYTARHTYMEMPSLWLWLSSPSPL